MSWHHFSANYVIYILRNLIFCQLISGKNKAQYAACSVFHWHARRAHTLLPWGSLKAICRFCRTPSQESHSPRRWRHQEPAAAPSWTARASAHSRLPHELADWLGAHSLLQTRSGRSSTSSARRTRASAATHAGTLPATCQWISQAARTSEDLAALAATCITHIARPTIIFSHVWLWDIVILWFYNFCYLSLQVVSDWLTKFTAFFHYVQ
jgi:hypothetical protein